MGKFLRVFFVAAVMSALCLAPALAADYPSELPPLPVFEEGMNSEDYSYVVMRDYDGIYYMLASRSNYRYALDDDGILNAVIDSGLNPPRYVYGLYYVNNGAWVTYMPMQLYEYGGSFDYGEIVYCNWEVMDYSENIVYPAGYSTFSSSVPEPGVLPSDYPDLLPDLPNLYEYVSEEGVDPYDCYIYVFRNVETGVYMYRFIADPSQFYYDADTLRYEAFSPGLYYYGGCEIWEAGEDYDAGFDFYPYFATYSVTEWRLDIVRNGELIYASGPVYASDGSLLYEDGFIHSSIAPEPPYVGPVPVPEKNPVPSHSYDSPSYLADPDAKIEFEAPGDPSDAEDPFNQLNLMVGSIFGILTQIYNLYAGTWLLTGFLMLWLIRKVSKLFNKL